MERSAASEHTPLVNRLEGAVDAPHLATLAGVESRVLWLATSIVHHANRVRATASGVKVGGHRASSASMVSIMTALYFGHLRGPDRVSVKPHASPVLHAIEYLLGTLDRRYLTTLREFGGLQSYPSRLKDPVPADFSTGSVGIGATAPIWSALAHRYVAGHFDVPTGGRQVSVVGDAELDEGGLGGGRRPDRAEARRGARIIDMNRQSLDRVVPNIAAGRIAGMFEAAGGTRSTPSGPLARGASRATAARRSASGSSRCRTRSISGCSARRRRCCASACPGTAPAGGPSRTRSRTSTTRSCCSRSATSAATTCRCCSTRSPPPTRWSTARR